MKRIISTLLVCLSLVQSAYADTCAKNLVGPFTSNQAVELCATFVGTSTISASLIPGSDNAYDLGSTSFSMRSLYTGTSIISKTSQIFRVRQDAQRLFTLDGSSDTALTFTFGDAGTTAAQVLTVSASTSDADDDSKLALAGGGAESITRGAYLSLGGNESSLSGGAILTSGDKAASVLVLATGSTTGAVRVQDAAGITHEQFGPVYVPTMAATPVVGTNIFNPGLNIIPTAAANTAAIIGHTTPVPGQRFVIFNNSGNTVRAKAGGGATLNGATAGGWISMATGTTLDCTTVTTGNILCRLPAQPTPQGP